MPLPLHAFDRAELAALLAGSGEPGYRADQVLEWIYRRRVHAFDAMTNLPARLRAMLARETDPALPAVVRVQGSKDTTRKFLLQLRDGRLVETVLIPASPALYGSRSDRLTACVSSQVGCAYGCKFCASGLDGFGRNLGPDEIVGQVLRIEEIAGERVSNLVFMGMGEPLANFDHLLRAIRILNEPWGVGIGARHMTVSTSGLVPQIRALADQPLQVRLAISLHGATDEVRGRIMPVNRKYPIAELMEACGYFRARRKQRITFEYILIAGVNDTDADARALAGLARGVEAKVNVIPYNRVEGLAWERPSEDRQETFLALLTSRGIPATLRREKGHDIDAACGQLRLRTEAEMRAGTPNF
jgi:23S rRNA (adenine2503-C2)-methyltransferase